MVLQRNHPECSKLKGLWLVLRAGGEVPDEVDEVACCKWCSYFSCWKDSSASRNVQEDEIAQLPLPFRKQSPLRRGMIPGSFSHGSSMPKFSTRNGNSGLSQSKIEGDEGFRLEEDWSYEKGDIALDLVEVGNSKVLELCSDLSLSQGEQLNSSSFSLATEKSLSSFSTKNAVPKNKLESTSKTETLFTAKKGLHDAKIDQ